MKSCTNFQTYKYIYILANAPHIFWTQGTRRVSHLCWQQLTKASLRCASCSWLPVVMWERGFIQHSSHHFTKLQSMVTRIISYWLSGALSAKIAWFALFPAAVSLHFSKLAGAVPPSGYQFLPPRQRLDKINSSTIFTQTSCCKRTKITRSV